MNISKSYISTCSNGCCSIKLKPYVPSTFVHDYKHKIKKLKAGVFFYDPNLDKILLVQSRGEKWGPPKGTIEDRETIEQCAIREVFEETGLRVTSEQLRHSNKYRIDRATYFYIEKDSTDPTSVSNISNILDNDASGVMWITSTCLVDMYHFHGFDLNSHCKKLLQKFLKLKIS